MTRNNSRHLLDMLAEVPDPRKKKVPDLLPKTPKNLLFFPDYAIIFSVYTRC